MLMLCHLYFKTRLNNSMNIDTGLEKYDNVQSLLLLDSHFVSLTVPMIWVKLNDRWSDDHMGTVLIRCRSSDQRLFTHVIRAVSLTKWT